MIQDHGPAGAPIWELVKVTIASITEVVILSGVGYILARRGIIDKRTQTKINRINVSFFTPALLFSKVAFSLNPRRLAELVIVPIGFVLVTVVSLVSAWVLAEVTRLSKAQRNFAIACAISPNSNSLPVALMQALVMEVPQLHWDESGEPEDTIDGMLGRALTYLVLFSTLGMFLRWSVAASLLSTVEDAEEAEAHEESSLLHEEDVPDQERTSRLVHFEGADEADTDSNTAVQHPSDQGVGRVPPEPLTGGGQPPLHRSHSNGKSGPPAWARSFPNSPQASRPGSVYRDDEDAESEVADEPSVPTSGWTKFRRLTSAGFYKIIVLPLRTINNFMTAPLWAATASLVVAMIRPLQQALGSISPLVGALQTAGACSIPLTMIVLGAYFIEEKAAVDDLSKANKRIRSTSTTSQAARDVDSSVAPGQEGQRSAPPASPLDKSGSSNSPWRNTPRLNPQSSESTLLEAGSSTDDEDAADRLRQGYNPSRQMWPMSRLHRSSSGHQNSLTLSPAEKRQARKAKMERRTIFVAILSRMIITPIILIPAVAWYAISTRQNVVDDPVFITSACLIVGSPPALTLAQITSQKATGNSGFERLISRTIFVSYAILAAPTTILLVLAALLIAQND